MSQRGRQDATIERPPAERASTELDYCLRLADRVCANVGTPFLIDDARTALASAGVIEAVRSHDDNVLFDWLIEAASFQGVGNGIAAGYMERHGRPRAGAIAADLASRPSCPKLAHYWAFEGCRYHKGSNTCAEPEHLDSCPLPRLPLRNGRLNQAAYSLFLFFRDVTDGDFVGWIDQRLARASAAANARDRAARLRQALLEPLGGVYGVSNKVLSMALSELLLAADPGRPLWVETGAAMIAVDTLVHNWLHRTGILHRLGCSHPYGPRCYGPTGCAAVIEQLAQLIDARQFNPQYPACFPRFVQKAIWEFCATSGFNQCNGNRINDKVSCQLQDCPVISICDRRPLHN